MKVRICLASLVGALVAVLSVGAVAAAPALAGECSNEAIRKEQSSTYLPDCRAYELVTQGDSGDSLAVKDAYGFAGHFLYASLLPTPGESTGTGRPEAFVATRTAQGWQQTPLTVPQGHGPPVGEVGASEGVMFTDNFASALFMEPFQDAQESPRLDEATGTMVYEMSLSSGAVSALALPDSGPLTQSMVEFPVAYKEYALTTGWGAFLDGASQDGSRIFFSTTAKLTTAPGTPEDTHQASAEVYERTEGHTYLVGVLPDGDAPVCGAEVGQSSRSTASSGENDLFSYGAIAPNGANVVFHAPGVNAVGAECGESEEGLFLRNVSSATTVKLPGELSSILH